MIDSRAAARRPARINQSGKRRATMFGRPPRRASGGSARINQALGVPGAGAGGMSGGGAGTSVSGAGGWISGGGAAGWPGCDGCGGSSGGTG
jgi:hypothetical protein